MINGLFVGGPLDGEVKECAGDVYCVRTHDYLNRTDNVFRYEKVWKGIDSIRFSREWYEWHLIPQESVAKGE